MPAPSGPARTRGFALRSSASYASPGLRVSDAERADAADQLSKHYGDGRLDQAEFNERLDRAMSATTRSDLTGLLADLPGTEPPPETGRPQRDRQPRGARPPRGHGGYWARRVLAAALVLVIAVVAGHVLVRLYIPWLLIGVLAILWFRVGPWHRRR
jgi:Domain of unknown function (DUF1707)